MTIFNPRSRLAGLSLLVTATLTTAALAVPAAAGAAMPTADPPVAAGGDRYRHTEGGGRLFRRSAEEEGRQNGAGRPRSTG
ncbi:hypothetical protein [Winogradskya humida]|uniref:hypothetical protein n=1 Tax=Winogradskya humida TaxID=113566 RepID=UPI0019459541|nr:hypothetical protein [Actinoplanes humidus]